MTHRHELTWCQRHPLFCRLYVPVMVTATFIVQAWEVFH